MTEELYKKIWLLINDKIKRHEHSIKVRVAMFTPDNIVDFTPDGIINLAKEIGEAKQKMSEAEELLAEFEEACEQEGW